jgi:hypothetical protein
MLKTNPGAAPKTGPHKVILKGDLKAVHGDVLKDKDPCEGQQEKHIELPIPGKVLFYKSGVKLPFTGL